MIIVFIFFFVQRVVERERKRKAKWALDWTKVIIRGIRGESQSKNICRVYEWLRKRYIGVLRINNGIVEVPHSSKQIVMYCPTSLSNPNESNNIYRIYLFRLTSDEIQISHCISADFDEFIDEVSSSSFIKFWIVFVWFIKHWFVYHTHSWPCSLYLAMFSFDLRKVILSFYYTW